MQSKSFLIVLILSISILSGCISADKTVYVSNENNTLTLYKDNTFYIKSPDGSGISGAYRTDGDTVVLVEPPFSVTLELKKINNNLVYKSETYVRQ